MKCIAITLISMLLTCCSETSSRHKQPKEIDEDWQLETHTFSSNSYTPGGLLDTTFTKTYSYFNGVLVDTINSITIRRYKNDKLISKKEYDIDKKGTKQLANERSNQFDKRGNLVLSTMQTDRFMTKVLNDYNMAGRLVKIIVISRTVKRYPNDGILDSVMAHRNDKKQFESDTTVSLPDYDEQGNLIKTIITDTKGQVIRTVFNQYSGKEKISSYGINSSADTISSSTFEHEGNLIKQVNIISDEMHNVDTTWIDGKNVVKSISHNKNMNIKHKSIYIYNKNGDEIESMFYR